MTGKPARQLRTAWTEAWERDEAHLDPLPMPLQGILDVPAAHSMGGWVAITAAVEQGSRLDGIVVLDSPVRRRAPEEEAAAEGAAFGPLRTYPTLEAALACFRTVPDQPTSLPYVLDHVARTSVRKVDDGWTWKFDPLVLFDRPVPTGDLLRQVRCRVACCSAPSTDWSRPTSARTCTSSLLIDGGKSLVPYWLVAAAGRPTEEVRLDTGKRFDDLWRGGWDPVARLADQDLDGVARRGDLSVGRHAAVQLPRHRLSARVLRRVQPLDRRVLRDRARTARSGWARPRCARRPKASPISSR